MCELFYILSNSIVYIDLTWHTVEDIVKYYLPTKRVKEDKQSNLMEFGVVYSQYGHLTALLLPVAGRNLTAH